MTTTASAVLGVAIGLGAAVAGCSRNAAVSEPDPADVLVTVRDGRIAAPDSVASGWSRVRVEEEGGSHIVVVFRLPGVGGDTGITAFLAALDTAPVTPPPAVALGGPEVGTTGDVILHLAPGRYLLGCVSRGADGHRHAASGEWRILQVLPAATAAAESPPPATQLVKLVDFAYVTEERWAAGSHLLRIENEGHQDHQMRLLRLRAGSTMTDWLKAEDPDLHGEAVTGMARIGPGEAAYLPATLEAGSYVAYCLVVDPATRRQHVELGMMRAIRVE